MIYIILLLELILYLCVDLLICYVTEHGWAMSLIFCFCSNIHYFIPHMHEISGMSQSKDYEKERNYLLYEPHILLH